MLQPFQTLNPKSYWASIRFGQQAHGQVSLWMNEYVDDKHVVRSHDRPFCCPTWGDIQRSEMICCELTCGFIKLGIKAKSFHLTFFCFLTFIFLYVCM